MKRWALGLADDADTLWLDATWRLGRRHHVKLTYTSLERDRTNGTLERSFTWDGQVYTAGLDATPTSGTDILGGYYRFAVYGNERFEVGRTLGIGYLWIEAGIRGTAVAGSPGGGQGTTIDESSVIESPTGAVGGYTNIWLARRLVVRGDYLYINLTADESEASGTDWRIGADYYFLTQVGAGVQYKHYTYGYNRGAFEGELGGETRFAGVQAFVSLLF